MPIYECRCGACGITFEILAPVSEANRRRPCPRCARLAPRVASAFAIGATHPAAAHESADSPASSDGHAGHSGHSHHRRGRQSVPDSARLCWMDDKSAERFAAYKMGRGAEYDDKSAAKEDLRKRRGLPAPPAPDTSNSPVARMVARKKAAEAKKAAAAIKSGTPGTSPQ